MSAPALKHRSADVTLRLAPVAERDAVAAVVAACGLSTEDLFLHGTACLVAEEEGILLGVVGLEFGPMGACLLRSLGVVHAVRGQGLGSRLMNEAAEEARRRACDRLYLLSTDAGPFYARLGFRQVPVPELVAALHTCPHLRHSERLPDEVAWRMDL